MGVHTQQPDMINIPVQSLSEEEQQLVRQQEIRRQQMRRLRESSQDPMRPRRKKSDLMSHMNPSHRLVQQRRHPADIPKEQAPVKIPIKKVAAASQDGMWPRRRKSDLLIYQQTRNV